MSSSSDSQLGDIFPNSDPFQQVAEASTLVKPTPKLQSSRPCIVDPFQHSWAATESPKWESCRQQQIADPFQQVAEEHSAINERKVPAAGRPQVIDPFQQCAETSMAMSTLSTAAQARQAVADPFEAARQMHDSADPFQEVAMSQIKKVFNDPFDNRGGSAQPQEQHFADAFQEVANQNASATFKAQADPFQRAAEIIATSTVARAPVDPFLGDENQQSFRPVVADPFQAVPPAPARMIQMPSASGVQQSLAPVDPFRQIAAAKVLVQEVLSSHLPGHASDSFQPSGFGSTVPMTQSASALRGNIKALPVPGRSPPMISGGSNSVHGIVSQSQHVPTSPHGPPRPSIGHVFDSLVTAQGSREFAWADVAAQRERSRKAIEANPFGSLVPF